MIKIRLHFFLFVCVLLLMTIFGMLDRNSMFVFVQPRLLDAFLERDTSICSDFNESTPKFQKSNLNNSLIAGLVIICAAPEAADHFFAGVQAPHLLFLFGQAKYLSGDNDGAIAEWKKADALPYFVRNGEEALHYEKWSDAIRWYSIAIQLNSGVAEYWYERSQANSELGNLQAAIPDAIEAIQRNEDLEDAYILLGQTYRHLGELDEAEQWLFSAFDRFGTSRSSLYLGSFLLETRDGRAERVIRAGLTVDPMNLTLNYQMAVLLYSRGNLQEAVIYLEKAVEPLRSLAPHQRALYVAYASRLASWYVELGEREKAVSEACKVLNVSTDNERALSVLTLLSENCEGE